jgi:uncharacterized protein YaaN involved in tellurite resistance
MSTIKNALTKVLDKLDKTRTIDTTAVDRMRVLDNEAKKLKESLTEQKGQQNRPY